MPPLPAITKNIYCSTTLVLVALSVPGNLLDQESGLKNTASAEALISNIWVLIIIFNPDIGNGPTPLSNHVRLYKCMHTGTD